MSEVPRLAELLDAYAQALVDETRAESAAVSLHGGGGPALQALYEHAKAAKNARQHAYREMLAIMRRLEEKPE